MNVRIRCDLSFGAGVYYDGHYRVNHYNLRLWMTTNHSDPATHNIALERIKYFVYNEIDSTVFINVNNLEQCTRYALTGLNVTTLPTEPVDQIIGVMLFHKLNAIMEEHMIIVETELSSVLGDNITYLHSENELHSDLIVDAWWMAPDLVHCDQRIFQTEQVLALPQSSAWRDLDLAWPESTTDTDSGNVVVFADFKNHETK